MVFCLILIALFVFIWRTIYKDEIRWKSKQKAFKEATLASVFFSTVFGALTYIILNVFTMTWFATPREVSRTTFGIYSLETFNQTKGRFVLGSGSFDNTTNYAYYYKTSNGGFKMETIPVNRTTLFETKEVPFGVDIEFQRESNSKWILPFIHTSSSWYQTHLHIPEGSIIQEYNPHLTR